MKLQQKVLKINKSTSLSVCDAFVNSDFLRAAHRFAFIRSLLLSFNVMQYDIMNLILNSIFE